MWQKELEISPFSRRGLLFGYQGVPERELEVAFPRSRVARDINSEDGRRPWENTIIWQSTIEPAAFFRYFDVATVIGYELIVLEDIEGATV